MTSGAPTLSVQAVARSVLVGFIELPQRLADGDLAALGVPGDAGGLAVAVGVDDGDAVGRPRRSGAGCARSCR